MFDKEGPIKVSSNGHTMAMRDERLLNAVAENNFGAADHGRVSPVTLLEQKKLYSLHFHPSSSNFIGAPGASRFYAVAIRCAFALVGVAFPRLVVPFPFVVHNINGVRVIFCFVIFLFRF